MAALISHTTFDSVDAYAQSLFWSSVLGFTDDPNDPKEPGDDECMIFSADGSQRLLFVTVPDTKQGKNQVHLDLKPAADTRDAELTRLLGLGARQLDDRRRPDGSGWLSCSTPKVTSSASCGAMPNEPTSINTRFSCRVRFTT